MRIPSFALLALLAAAATFPAQVVINEFNCATPDFIELRNLSTSAVNVAGWNVATWQSSSGSLSSEGSYTLPPGTTIPAQGFLILEENGTAGQPGTLGSCAIRTGFNYNWTNTRTVVIALTDAGGTGVDYVFRNLASIPGTPNLPAGTSWTGSLNTTGNAVSRNADLDTNSSSDWTTASSSSACSLNPGQMNIPPVDLSITTAGMGDVQVSIVTTPAIPNAEFFTLVSAQDLMPNGSGPIFGVALDVIPQLGWPAFAGNPFHSHLDAAGQFSRNFPPTSVPSGLTIEAVSIVLDGATIKPSPVVQITF